jgi:Zn-dependent peptidase ImmA (M78 family)
MDDEIGPRVKKLLQRSDLPRQQDAAAAVTMTADAFSRSLSGKRSFSARELVDLAELFNTSVHWLVTGNEDPSAVLVGARHTYDHDQRTHRVDDWNKVVSSVQDVALLYEQVYDPTGLPALPIGRAASPADTADEARSQLEGVSGLGFVKDFAGSIEATFGVDVVKYSGAPERGSAFIVGGRRGIVINASPFWFFQNFSLAHELGHFALNELVRVTDASHEASTSERRVNAFAIELLLPAQEMRATAWDDLSVAEIARFVWEHGISTPALVIRLRGLGLLSRRVQDVLSLQTIPLLREGIKRGFRLAPEAIDERMRNAGVARFPAHLLQSHRDAVVAGNATPRSLAWMLAVPVEQLEEQLTLTIRADDMNFSDRDHDDIAAALGLL